MVLNRLVSKSVYSFFVPVNDVLIRLQSTSEATTAIEVDCQLERRHTTPASYEKLNKKYLIHPKSAKPSNPLTNNNHTLVKLLETLKSGILSEVVKNPPEIYRSAEDADVKDHDIVFLTQEEWNAAQNNLVERYKYMLNKQEPLMSERNPVHTEVTEDEGLAWLFDNAVTFVDSSKISDDVDRYIVTRETDGTLHHNNYTERDVLNGRFFKSERQMYPPADVFEKDEFFMGCITHSKQDPVYILEQLYQSYSSDHPMFVQRHSQLVNFIFMKPEMMTNVITSRFFVDVVHRAVINNVSMQKVIDHLAIQDRQKLVFALESLAEYQENCMVKDAIKSNKIKKKQKSGPEKNIMGNKQLKTKPVNDQATQNKQNNKRKRKFKEHELKRNMERDKDSSFKKRNKQRNKLPNENRKENKRRDDKKNDK